MPFTVTFDPDKQFVNAKFFGILDRESLWEYVSEMNTHIKKEKANLVLSDFREAVVPFSVAEIFHLPDEHEKFNQATGVIISTIKRAMLFSDSNHELVQFFENVATNRGQSVKVFGDETEALAWLLMK